MLTYNRQIHLDVRVETTSLLFRRLQTRLLNPPSMPLEIGLEWKQCGMKKVVANRLNLVSFGIDMDMFQTCSRQKI